MTQEFLSPSDKEIRRLRVELAQVKGAGRSLLYYLTNPCNYDQAQWDGETRERMDALNEALGNGSIDWEGEA